MEQTDYEQELQYLDTVLDVIDRQLVCLRDKEAKDKESLLSSRQFMWDDVTHIVRDFDDIADLSAQNQAVAGETAAYLATAAEIKKLNKMRDTPYFGRFNFMIKGGSQIETIYIGARSLLDEDSYEIYIYDWRAPVSSVFYEYDPGASEEGASHDASYKTPDGTQRIQLVLKRQYKIENGKMLYMYDTGSSMHDEILGQILSRNTSNRLKVIVSSIQKEQNAAIRNPHQKLMLIYGLAGSGKTSVGLHRMAYLLYHHRDSIKAEDIVVLSSNEIFNSYIANILPDLGETDVSRVLFGDLLSGVFNKDFAIENQYDQYKALTHPENSNRADAVRIKYSYSFLSFCIDYFNSFHFLVPELRYKDAVILSKTEFQAKWDALRFSSFRAHIDNISELIRSCYEDYFVTNKKSIREDIVRESDHELTEQLVSYRYEGRLAQHISSALEEVKYLNSVEALVQLCRILTLYAAREGLPDAFISDVMTAFEEKRLRYEDALIYYLVCVLMGEAAPSNHTAHVLIDEAQDYNLLQLFIIKTLYPKSYYTLLADVNQAVSSVTSVHHYADFERIFGGALEAFRLHRSYRSSGPISALAFQLLRKLDSGLDDTFSFFNREGSMPQYIVTQKAAEAVLTLMEGLAGCHLIGIVTGSEEDAVGIHAALNSRLCAQLITKPEDKIAERVVILPLILAKGLEFDAVFLINGFTDTGDEAACRRRAYLGCTRALHELYMINNTPLPQCFEDCIPYVNMEPQ